jgi:hypothetical protein
MEPRFMPVIISSINPQITQSQPIIAATLTEGNKTVYSTATGNRMYYSGVATDLAIQAGEQQTEAELPKEYQEFAQLFSNEAADRFPPSREWDHAIDLKPGAPDALDCKVYPMTRDEDTAPRKIPG